MGAAAEAVSKEASKGYLYTLTNDVVKRKRCAKNSLLRFPRPHGLEGGDVEVLEPTGDERVKMQTKSNKIANPFHPFDIRQDM